MDVISGTDIRILNKSLERGRIKYAIFDFDGTISILREGWERIMEPVMIESICGDHPVSDEVVRGVREFIDETTGIQTILQMEGLVEMVKEFGLVPADKILDSWGYKKIYNDRLMVPVRRRIADLQSGRKTLADCTVAGSIDFCQQLYQRNVIMYTASGTDQEDVRNEANVLGVDKWFKGGVYGAIGSVEEYSKDKVIKEILRNNNLHGAELVVLGDGPVEIRNAKENGAIAVGIASNEVTGRGWEQRKIERLTKAGCDLLMPDFRQGRQLLEYLFDAKA
ncbi:MAG TPA: HAD hydrolase-like protein [bacterium]|nr:HAD hydrolase-like protein [bacterium]